MKAVRRTRGIRKIIRVNILRRPVHRYAAAGDRACGRLVSEARNRRKPGPSDYAILTWASFDLSREILGGFWEIRTA